MKLTTARLKKLIREELNKVNESRKETIKNVMLQFTIGRAEEASKRAIAYGVADEVLKELERLEQETMEKEQAKKYAGYIKELNKQLAAPPEAPKYTKSGTVSTRLDV
jgi:hypothetical protein